MCCMSTLLVTALAVLFVSSSLPVDVVPLALTSSPLNKGAFQMIVIN